MADPSSALTATPVPVAQVHSHAWVSAALVLYVLLRHEVPQSLSEARMVGLPSEAVRACSSVAGTEQQAAGYAGVSLAQEGQRVASCGCHLDLPHWRDQAVF